MHEVWFAFHELCSERQLGMAIGPIPWSSIKRYGIEELRIEDEDAFDRFHQLIRIMDDEYLRLASSQMKQGGKGKKGGERQVEEVAITDTVGTRELLLNLAARAKSAKAGNGRKPR